MSATTVALAELSQNGSQVTYAATSRHSNAKPALVISKVKPAKGASGSIEASMTLSYATVDSADVPLSAKCSIQIIARYPVNAKDGVSNTDLANAILDARDLFSSDEWNDFVGSGLRLDR